MLTQFDFTPQADHLFFLSTMKQLLPEDRRSFLEATSSLYLQGRSKRKQVVPLEQWWKQWASQAKASPSAGGNLFTSFSEESMDGKLWRLPSPVENQMLQSFSVSASALNSFLDCARNFYLQYLVRMPSRPSTQAAFGTAIHRGLEQMITDRKDFFSNESLSHSAFQAFQEALEVWRDLFTPDGFQQKLEAGKYMLNQYIAHQLPPTKILSITERIFQVRREDGWRVKGIVDRLDFQGKSVRIIDYKTGKPENAIEALHPPNDQNPLGGSYWRQAQFYQYLIGLAKPDWEVKEIRFELLGEGNLQPPASNTFNNFGEEQDLTAPSKTGYFSPQTLIIMPDKASQETLKQQMNDFLKALENKDFNRKCNKPICLGCTWLKDNP